MSRNVLIRFVAGVVLVAVTQVNAAEDELASELYGRGIHAFFSRDYGEAHQQFSASIEQGSRDPRCFYFRGLALSKLGRPEDAGADIKQGAELELANTDMIHDVSVSLQRVQGPERLLIEKQRAGARLEASRKAKAIRDAVYEQWKRDEENVLSKPKVNKPKELFAAPGRGVGGGATRPSPGNAVPRAVDDPFGGSGTKKTATPPKDDQDPFGDSPAPPEKPSASKTAPSEDPFGDTPATPPAPANKPAPKKDNDDPFGN